MKTVLITGGSRGIGAQMVRDFARAGYFVVLNYNKSKTEAAKLKEELGSQILCIQGDVANETAVAKLFAEVQASIGGVDILVNNAGVSLTALFQETSAKQTQQVFANNFFGACNCIRCALPDMIAAKKGRIINIASIWGEVGAANESIYAASKAALIGLTKSLSKELAPCHITVNAISPGAIQTDMLNEYTKEELSVLQNEIPLQKLGEAVDVSQMAIYLASEAASYITGQIIRVDGGMHI